MINVLHINTMKGLRGGERQSLFLAKGLLKKGFNVGFVCQPESEMENKLRKTSIKVHPIPIRCEADFAAIWQIAGLVRKHKYDIIHMHDSHAHLIGGCAALLSGKPLRVVSRRVDFSIHRHGFGFSIIKYRYFADAFITVSDAVRSALIQDGVPKEMISVVHSGIDVSLSSKSSNLPNLPNLPNLSKDFNGTERRDLNNLFGFNGETKIIGAVGSLVGHKGHKFFVDAATEILKKKPETRFVIFGEGILRKNLETQIEKNGLTGKFFLPGHNKAAARLAKGFDLFVMPSVMEGLGTAMLDAMASGVPVVAAKAGGIPEAIEDNKTGLLAKTGDSHSLATAILRVLDDNRLSKNMTEKAREVVNSNFTIDRMVDKTILTYRKLLEKR